LAHFGIYSDEFKYSQYTKDVVAVLRRKGWSVRSRLSSLPKRVSVGRACERLAKISHDEYHLDKRLPVYLIQVAGHVLLVNALGTTLVDTDPRKRDRRPVQKIYRVTLKR